MRRSVLFALLVVAALIALLLVRAPALDEVPEVAAVEEEPAPAVIRPAPPAARPAPAPPPAVEPPRVAAPRPAPVPATDAITLIEGRVLLPAGTDPGDVLVHGCPGRAFSPDEDGTFACEVPPGTRRLVTRRRSGALSAPGTPVEVVVQAGSTVEVTLDVAEYEPAGLGVAIDGEPDGVRVVRVQEDTPAWDAGLQAGDLIVAVDGQETAGMNVTEFQTWALGPEGTRVSIDVVGADGAHRFEVIRERIPASITRN